MTTFDDLETQGRCSTETALELFDALPPVKTDFMFGKWRGEDFPTGHPMDGHLATISWYGKEFLDDQRMHPLVCRDRKGRFFNLDPKFLQVPMTMSALVPRHPLVHQIFERTKAPITTKKPRARCAHRLA